MYLKQSFVGAAALVFVIGGLLLGQGPMTGQRGTQDLLTSIKQFLATSLDLTNGQKAEAGRIISAPTAAPSPSWRR